MARHRPPRTPQRDRRGLTATPPHPAAPTERRAWHVVTALAISSLVTYGALTYAFAVLLVPVAAALDATLATVTGAFSVALLVSAAAAVPVGRALDRFGGRPVLVIGTTLGALTLLTWSYVQTVTGLYATFVLMGLAWAGAHYEPAFVIINRWFGADRARPLFAVTVVAGFAATVAMPATRALLDVGGWRWALRVLAAVLAACVVVQLGVVRSAPLPAEPAGSGTRPRPWPSAESRAARTAAAPRPGVEVAWLTLAAAAAAAAVSIVTVHLVAYLTGRGTDPLTAAVAAGSLGIMSVTGRILFTAAAARLGVARTSATMVALQAAGVAALLWLPGTAGLVVLTRTVVDVRRDLRVEWELSDGSLEHTEVSRVPR
ncbi:MFS transporter [Cellulomonas hominis]|uniref:MFS family permease n=2 Tax=Cellulomonas hominis TaxID=156981 RepID=A0A7W8WBP1_9CELL|nr:MFS family permease [Cellulomonas hominis]NKY05718.1 MFS transporter [Cellulomonas hominis]